MLFPEQRPPRFRCHLMNFDASSEVRLHSSLSSTPDVIKTPRLLTMDVHHRGFWTEAAHGSLKPPPTGRLRGAYPPSFVQHDAFASS